MQGDGSIDLPMMFSKLLEPEPGWKTMQRVVYLCHYQTAELTLGRTPHLIRRGDIGVDVQNPQRRRRLLQGSLLPITPHNGRRELFGALVKLGKGAALKAGGRTAGVDSSGKLHDPPQQKK